MTSKTINVTPPNDLSEYIAKDGHLHRSTSERTVLWGIVHHRSGRYKQHLLKYTTDDKPETYLDLYDEDGLLQEDFVDENLDFIPFAYTDGTLIENASSTIHTVENSTQSSTTHTAQFLSAVEAISRNASSAHKDLPTVNVWNGHPDGWYTWKEDIYSRMLA